MSDNKSYWRCTQKNCLGRLYIVNNSEVVKENGHQHKPNAAKIQAKIAVQKIKEIVRNTELSSQSLLVTVAEQVSFNQYKFQKINNIFKF